VKIALAMEPNPAQRGLENSLSFSKIYNGGTP
jgi:hypothetical protein